LEVSKLLVSAFLMIKVKSDSWSKSSLGSVKANDLSKTFSFCLVRSGTHFIVYLNLSMLCESGKETTVENRIYSANRPVVSEDSSNLIDTSFKRCRLKASHLEKG
jgi:hypothetical protein